MELGIQTKKTSDFSKWYLEIVTKCHLIDYTDISGCYVIRENAYQIWEKIKSILDMEIKQLGVKNIYFPLFITKSALTREQTHIDDFAPEVAWVTHTGKGPDIIPIKNNEEENTIEELQNRIKILEQHIEEGKLEEPLAIRPTSETSMYPHYSKWIKSHRDLPLKLNQWNNVVRWEFKHPTPFIRSREFLWQEGHTCYANKSDAIKEVDVILDIYEKVYRELLALPTIKGTKTEKERFAGADITKTVETFILESNKAIQAATSHHLGQNFSKQDLFNISYEDVNGNKQYVYQNSWGFTTRSIGIMIMMHSDDKGLVLPPKVAPIQIMIIPIYKKNKEHLVDDYAQYIKNTLTKLGFKVDFDNRKGYRPGFKYNECETNGIPLRIDVGLRDIANQTFDITRRDTLEKLKSQKLSDLTTLTRKLLKDIHNTLFENAYNKLHQSIHNIPQTQTLVGALDTIADSGIISMDAITKSGIISIEFCGNVKCEENIKEQAMITHNISIKSLCVPDNFKVKDLVCINCGTHTKGKKTLFGRSF